MALFQIVKQKYAFIRWQSYDLTLPSGVESERIRRATLTTLTSVLAKFIGMATAFISVPLALNYLGVERYGLWMTVSSIIVILGFLDLGVGNSLINIISSNDSLQNKRKIKLAISNSFVILLICAFMLMTSFYLSSNYISWGKVYGIDGADLIHEAQLATALVICCFAINLILSISQKIQIGHQEGYINNIWQLVGNICGLLTLIIFIKMKLSMVWLVFAISGIPLIAMAINCYLLFFKKYPNLLPNYRLISIDEVGIILKKGSIFVLLWVVNILGTSTDKFIISRYLGTEQVAIYATIEQLFSITLLIQFLTIPLWPAFSAAFSSGDIPWIQKTFRRIFKITIIATLSICIPLMMFSEEIIIIWTKKIISPSIGLIVGYGVFRIVSSVAEVAMPIMLTENFIKKLAAIAVICGILSFILKILLVAIYKDVAIIAWVSALVYGLLFTTPVLIIAYYSTKNKGK